MCRVPHHEYARVDREFYSKDPIIAVVSPTFIIRAQVPYVNSYEGWYGSIPTNLSSRLFATSIICALIPHREYAKGYTVPFKGNLFPRLSAVHAALNAWVPFL